MSGKDNQVLTLKLDADTVRHVLDTLLPQLLVQLGVKSDILDTHCLTTPEQNETNTRRVKRTFCAKVTTDFTAHGARFLNERPCTSLCRWIVYSRVTTSWSAERVLPVCQRIDGWLMLVGDKLKGHAFLSDFVRAYVAFI